MQLSVKGVVSVAGISVSTLLWTDFNGRSVLIHQKPQIALSQPFPQRHRNHVQSVGYALSFARKPDTKQHPVVSNEWIWRPKCHPIPDFLIFPETRRKMPSDEPSLVEIERVVPDIFDSFLSCIKPLVRIHRVLFDMRFGDQNVIRFIFLIFPETREKMLFNAPSLVRIRWVPAYWK